MSLVSGGIGGAVGAGAQLSSGVGWTPPQQSSSHQHSAGGGCCDGPSLQSLLAPAPGEVVKGEIVNDDCITVDVFAATGNIYAASWSERDGSLSQSTVADVTAPIVNMSADVIKHVQATPCTELELDSVWKDLESKGQISFGRGGQEGPDKTLLKAHFPLSKMYAGITGQDMDLVPLSLLLLRGVDSICSVNAARAASSAAASSSGDSSATKKKKSKKSKRGKKTLTLVVPCGFSQKQTEHLIDASVEYSALPIRNVFNRGVSAVAGALYKDASSSSSAARVATGVVLNIDEDLQGIFSQHLSTKTNSTASRKAVAAADHLVFYFNVSSCLVEDEMHMGSNSATHFDAEATPSYLTFDAALVSCEGGESAKAGGRNALGFDRLNTLATMGGSVREHYKWLKQKERTTGSTDGVGVDGWGEKQVKKPADMADILLELGALVCADMLKSSAEDADGAVATVVLDGLLSGKCLFSQYMKTEKLKSLKTSSGSQPFSTIPAAYMCSPFDAANGAALLSAAELTSSKEYIQNEEDGSCRIAYLLPIADSILQGGDIALRTFWSPAEHEAAEAAEKQETGISVNSSDKNIEILFSGGMRVPKRDCGPLRPLGSTSAALENIVINRAYDWGSTYRKGRCVETTTGKGVDSAKERTVGYPYLQLLQRSPGGGRGDRSGNSGMWDGGKWQVLASARPLAKSVVTQKAGKTWDAVRSASVSMSITPSNGMINVSVTQGRSIREIQKDHFGWVKFVCLICLPFLLYLAYALSGHVTQVRTHIEHVEWLTEFYVKNAPEKLKKDANFVERTVRKYEKDDKMFVLWRTLEKNYDTKYRPPPSILGETTASAPPPSYQTSSSNGANDDNDDEMDIDDLDNDRKKSRAGGKSGKNNRRGEF